MAPTTSAGRPSQGRAGTTVRDRRYKKAIGPRGRRRNSRESARKIEEGWAGADASYCGLWGQYVYRRIFSRLSRYWNYNSMIFLPPLHVIWDLENDPAGNVQHIAEHGV
jgi:hypothetical protein